jgi:hypothetical protein
MDFKDTIKQLAERVEKLRDNLQTEEATKNALIMPFLQSLGYDVFNPIEVVPEFTCDIGTKKGEKIDYAIMKDGVPILLIECKHWGQNLNLHDNQLLRYFNVSNAKFGLLTNGVIYKFYTDLVKKNVMDEVPFLEVDLTNLRDSHVEELRKFHKSYFDVAKILDTATDLKYTSEIKLLIQNEFTSPSEQFVRLLAKQVYPGLLNQKMIEYFSVLVKKSFTSLINDTINDRLQSALNNEVKKETPTQESEISAQEDSSAKIETTQEELEGYYTIKAILADCIEPERIIYKDNMNYLAINIDNIRKMLCRLYFNRAQHYIGLFDESKNETKYPINSIYDVIQYKQQLIDRVNYLKQ